MMKKLNVLSENVNNKKKSTSQGTQVPVLCVNHWPDQEFPTALDLRRRRSAGTEVASFPSSLSVTSGTSRVVPADEAATATECHLRYNIEPRLKSHELAA